MIRIEILMSEIPFDRIVDEVRKTCIEANCLIEEDVASAIRQALDNEESPVGQKILQQILANHEKARETKLPLCQDTGVAVFFVELGQDVRISGGLLEDAINEGVRQGYAEGYLRNSIVSGPLSRRNTGDNTPAVIHYSLIPGVRLKILFCPKGGGSENMSSLAMLRPGDGVDGVRRFVINAVKKGGSHPCPPIIVGVGIGGTFEKCAILAKKALIRPIGSPNPKLELAHLEESFLEEINKLGIGPMGLGGRVTALAVHIETFPCHIASLPVAVNINCHAARHKEILL
jgi:fumarate hydratase subunit alpha